MELRASTNLHGVSSVREFTQIWAGLVVPVLDAKVTFVCAICKSVYMHKHTSVHLYVVSMNMLRFIRMQVCKFAAPIEQKILFMHD